VVVHRQRVSTLLIGVGVLMMCLAIPATLVGAQAPAPAPDPNAPAAPAEAPEAPATQPQPEAPPPGTEETPAPNATPPPVPAQPDQATTPAPAPVAQAAASGSVAILDGSLGSDFRFSPSTLTVGTGDTVTWTNNGAEPHDVTGSGLDSGTLQPGQAYSHTFTSPGNYSYICSIHPFMKGSVTVQGASSGGGGGGGGSDAGSSQDPSASTASGSESAAVTSPGAAGSDTQLPSTGMTVLPLLAAGLGLLLAGGMLRRRARLS
jgi:LPXTG-motif cell wall-anchored protein